MHDGAAGCGALLLRGKARGAVAAGGLSGSRVQASDRVRSGIIHPVASLTRTLANVGRSKTVAWPATLRDRTMVIWGGWRLTLHPS